jgi:hypothetical protein
VQRDGGSDRVQIAQDLAHGSARISFLDEYDRRAREPCARGDIRLPQPIGLAC